MEDEEIIQVLKNVASLDNKITYQQWLNYINNYENYKELPASWWTELA